MNAKLDGLTGTDFVTVTSAAASTTTRLITLVIKPLAANVGSHSLTLTAIDTSCSPYKIATYVYNFTVAPIYTPPTEGSFSTPTCPGN